MIAFDVYLCGWRVQSEIPLPELLPWTTPQHPVDVRIRLGRVPPLADIVESQRRLTVDKTGVCRLEIPGICTFTVSDGREVVVDPEVPLDSLDLRNYLFGTGLGLLCHQRGVFPLHGSCLRFGDNAIVFSGNSGAGKSTLAAALAQRGHTLLSDDVCALSDMEGGWFVRPAFPRVKLQPASLKAIFGESPDHPPIRLQGKHHFRFEPVSSFDPNPVPLAAIYFLEKAEQGQTESIVEVSGIEKLALINSQVFRPRMGRALGRQSFLRGTALRLAGAVAVRRFCRSFDLSRIDATVALLEQKHGAPSSLKAP